MPSFNSGHVHVVVYFLHFCTITSLFQNIQEYFVHHQVQHMAQLQVHIIHIMNDDYESL